MTDIKKKVYDAIYQNKEEHLELLRKLVSFESKIIDAGVTGLEKGIQDYLKVLFADMGAEIDAFEPDNEKIKNLPGYNPNHTYKDRENVVAIFRGNGTGRSLLLNGHSDIVPADDADKWTSPPFECEIRDNKIYGRGTVDMKAGSSAAILAIKLLLDMGLKFNGDIIFEAVIDEEGGGNGTIACCEKGYRADGAIIMEPTGMVVMPNNRGTFLAEFTVQGKPIHSSLKGFGVNAIEKAIKLMNVLKEIESQWLMTKRHPLISNPTINFGQITGGDGASTVAGECNVKFAVEFLPSELTKDYALMPIDPEDVKKEVQAQIDLACNGDPWLRDNPVAINWYQETLCFETDVDTEFVEAVAGSCRDVTGKTIIAGFPSGCDGAPLSKIGKMPVIILGPGDGKQAHTIDEFVELDQFYKAIEIYANVIIDWVGVS